MISFHIECARRANYFLEVERVDRERNYRVFCEKHRPLKIVREMEEKELQGRKKMEQIEQSTRDMERRYQEEINRQMDEHRESLEKKAQD